MLNLIPAHSMNQKALIKSLMVYSHIFILLFVGHSGWANTIYVNHSATGENNGSNWEDAHNDLQDALAAAEVDDEIWVATGRYIPGTTRDATFQLKEGVALYGGFKGNETTRKDRNWRINRTILSGDVNGDDEPNFSNYDENVYHVVTGANDAILDRFTITGGNANGDDFRDKRGGGMMGGASMKIIHCIFEKNKAFFGGGLAEPHDSTVTNCIFRRNRADYSGGGVNSSNTTFSNCIFSGNVAMGNGGGIARAFKVINCTFVGNTAEEKGGGTYNGMLSDPPKIDNCIFWANTDGTDDVAAGQLTHYSGIPSGISFSLVQGWPTPGVDGNLNAIPLFVNAEGPDGFYGTEDDNLHLLPGSPAIDSGDTNAVPPDTADLDNDEDVLEPLPLDFELRSRVIDNGVDMGALESVDNTIHISAENMAAGASDNGIDDFFYITLDSLGFNVMVEASHMGGRENSTLIYDGPLVEIRNIRIDGSSDNDALTVDHSNGLVNVSIEFTAGSGTNALILLGRDQSDQLIVDSDIIGIGSATTSFEEIEDLEINAGDGDDSLTIKSMTALAEEVELIGGAGLDVLIGTDISATWTIEGMNHGKISEWVFSGVEDLRGGNENDLFVFNPGSQLNGSIDGGGGTDTLDYTTFGTPAVIIEKTAETGLSGRELTSLGNGFSGIDLFGGARPTLAVDNQSAVEGEIAQFTVSLSLPSSETVMVDYRTEDGEAISGEDYKDTAGTLIFAPGETEKSIEVEVFNDILDESIETFRLLLRNPSHAALSASAGIGTIQATVIDIEAPSGTNEGQVAQFNVSLSIPSTQKITIDFQTENAEAVGGIDYRERTGTLIFAPGETLKSIRVEISKDNEEEPTETFSLRLSNPVNATISTSTAVGVIHDAVGPIFVDIEAAGNNDGSSWEDAYIDLQKALAIAEPGDVIWVASGTYIPGQNRDSTFQLPNGTSLYGGFSGIETSRTESNPGINVTILSGDIAGDDNDIIRSLEPTRAENCYHVVTVNSTDAVTVLGGFVIMGGNANGLGNLNKGGGIFNQSENLTVTNCSISRNSSSSNGGGMFNSSSKPTVIDCEFSSNSTGDGGGGMANADSDPTVINCIFSGNSGKNGGAILNYLKSHPTLDDCTFVGNSVDDNGGAIFNSQSNPLITRCRFIRNRTLKDDGRILGGGGILNASGSEPIVRDCLFLENSTRNYGGGMFNPSSSPSVIRCTFTGNSAENGGGISNHSGIAKLTSTSNPKLINCIFNENIASDDGGGIYNFDSHPTFVNCTFQKNNANTKGGGIHNDAYGMIFTPHFIGPSAGSRSTVTNCIFWENTAGDSDPELFNSSHSSSTVTHSCVQGGYPGVANIDENPLLTRDGHLRAGSPCLNSGTSLESIESDLDGESRPYGDAVDIGADEFIDSDSDSLPDWLELQLTANKETLQAGLDFDEDGLSNLHEYERSLNQRNPDTDFDGRWDGDEVVTDSGIELSTDPSNPDSIFAAYKRVFESEFLTPELEGLTWVFHSTLVDTDDDNDLDILITHIDGRVEVHENIGTAVSPSWKTPVMPEFNVEIPDGSRVYMTDIVDTNGEMIKDELKDLVIVNAKGELTLVRNSGNSEESPWGPPELNWAGSTAFIPTFDTPGDIDLDGDLDRFVGLDADSKPVFETNIDEHLIIRPRYLTIVQGENQQLEIEGDHGEVAFSLVQNTSGAAITDDGLYTAGINQIGVDVIRAITENGTSGLVVVNVISPDEADRNAKVLIVVGTRSAEDSLFSTSERLAMDAYVVCRQRGYRSSDICLLTPNGTLSKSTHLGYPIAVADNNGQLETAIKDWASDVDDLILYFVDHGVVREGLGNLVLRPGTYLNSETLKAWLDDWQTQKAERTSLVIIDTCYSGHFVEELAFGSPQRIVMAASEPGALAHFQGNGSISFSQLFWDETAAGAATHEAFQITVNNLTETLDQVPLIDTNGDGVEEEIDGIERVRSIGLADLLGGIQRPAVGTVMDDVTIDESTATLWCRDVVSSNGILNMIAYIVPPTLQTEVEGGSALTDMDNLELIDYVARRRIVKSDFESWQELPEQQSASGRLTLSGEIKDLLLSSYTEIEGIYVLNDDVPASDLQRLRTIEERLGYPPRYEADWEEFDTPGLYRILFFAEDNWGMLSTVRSARVTVEGPGKKAMIIECHGITDVDTPWLSDEIERQAQLVRQTLHNRSFAAEDIQWFGLAHQAVDKARIADVFTSDFVEDIDELTLYLVGNATVEGVLLTDDDRVTPPELKGWLDTLQNSSPCRVTVVVETDYSGSFLAGLANSAYERYVVTSTDSVNRTLRSSGLTFGNWFWGEVRRGRSIQQAFIRSKAIARASQIQPIPFSLDDDGNGIYEKKKDGLRASDKFIGTLFLTGDDEVQIGSVSKSLVLNPGDSGLLFVKDAFSPDGADLRVTATLIQAATGEIMTDDALIMVNAGSGHYQRDIHYDDFPEPGRYVAIIQAASMNDSTLSAIPVPVDIFVGVLPPTSSGAIEDTYPRLVVDDDATAVELDDSGQDIYRLWAVVSQAITIELEDVSEGADVRLAILAGPQKTNTPLEEADDSPAGIGELIFSWNPPDTGWYYVQVEAITVNEVPASYSIGVTSEHFGADGFEEDDIPEMAKWISWQDGEFQEHNFHDEGDEDWVFFFARKDTSYQINVFREGVNCDVVLELYEEVDGDFSLLQNVDQTQGNDETITYQRGDTAGRYYIRIRHANPLVHNVGTEYRIRVIDETGGIPGILMVLIHDNFLNEQLLAGNVSAAGLDPFRETENVYVLDSVPAGTYDVTVRVNGYQPNPASQSVDVRENDFTEAHFNLTPISLSDRTVSLKKGWNMTSLPFIPRDNRVETLFQNRALSGEVWSWNDGKLQPAQKLLPKTGYWVYCHNQEEPLTIQGMDVIDTAKTLNKGWNLFGAASNTPLPEAIEGPIWYWDDGIFKKAQTLKADYGYWMYTDEPVTIDFNAAPETD